MNNSRGFVVTGILYSLLILFSIIVFGMLFIASSRQSLFYKLENEIVGEMGSFRKEYRYLKNDFTYSNWISYQDASDIYHTYPLTIMRNSGESNHQFSLEGHQLEVLISNGHAGIRFNGVNSFAESEANGTTASYPTIYLDFSASTCGHTLASFDGLDKSISLDSNCKFVISSNGSTNMTTSEYTYQKGTRVKVVFRFENGVYDMYILGKKYTGTTTSSAAEVISMSRLVIGYHEKNQNQFFQGILYTASFDKNLVSEAQAISLSSTEDNEAYLKNATLVYNYTKYIHTR